MGCFCGYIHTHTEYRVDKQSHTQTQQTGLKTATIVGVITATVILGVVYAAIVIFAFSVIVNAASMIYSILAAIIISAAVKSNVIIASRIEKSTKHIGKQ